MKIAYIYTTTYGGLIALPDEKCRAYRHDFPADEPAACAADVTWFIQQYDGRRGMFSSVKL